MSYSQLLLLLLVAVLLQCCCSSGPAVQHVTCVRQTSSCSCDTSDGRTIDLTPLVTNAIAGPIFPNVVGLKDGAEYSYNPCVPFTEGSCQAVALCQQHQSLQYSLGSQDSATFITSAQLGLQLRYVAESLNPQAVPQTRVAYVQLLCDGEVSADFTVDGETADNSMIFEMRLVSRYACPRGKENPVSSTASWSTTTSRDHWMGECRSWQMLTYILAVMLSLCLIAAILGLALRRPSKQVVKAGKDEVPYENF